MNTDFTVVIPARFASSRLPAKIIAPIAGKPMVQWVYEKALQSLAKNVVVAADDEKIVEALKPYGTHVIMTSPNHPSGTDRLEEVAQLLRLEEDDIVVNVQGDEPLIPAVVINQVAKNLAGDGDARVATLCEAIHSRADFLNPNVVKVVFDFHHHALYFSRAAIPWPRDESALDHKNVDITHEAYRHIGIYGYRVGLLREFVTWPVAPLENIEKLEQLRVMYNGAKIHVEVALEKVPGGVDTADDLERIRRLLEENN